MVGIYTLPFSFQPTWLSTTAISASCVLLLLGYVALPNAQERAILHIPTAKSTLLLLRNTLDVMSKRGSKIHDWFLENCRLFEGKPWRMRVLGRPPTLVFSSPEAFEDVLKTHFNSFVKGPAVSTVLYDVLGSGIFAVDGMMWMHQRKTSSHLFSLQNIRESMEGVVMNHCELLCQRFSESARKNEVFNLKRVLDLFTMDIFTKIGFGVDLNGLQSNANVEFLDAFERTLVNVAARFRQPQLLWRLKRWLNVGREKQLAADMKFLDSFVFNIIERSMAESTNKEEMVANEEKYPSATSIKPRTNHKTLVLLFLEKSDMEYANGKRGITDPIIVRDMTLNFIVAGRDTTSGTMSWFILMLNRYPQVLQKIRKEIAKALPDLASGKILVPSMDDTQHLPYLEATIKETLRLFPVVALTSRSSTQDLMLYDGTFIKKGTRVVLSHYSMARLKQVWGEDADQYNPDRWIDPTTGKVLQISPFKFSTFLAGPRMCLGMKFALMELKITLATILTKFDITTVKDPFDFTYRAAINFSIDGPLDVTIRPIGSVDCLEKGWSERNCP